MLMGMVGKYPPPHSFLPEPYKILLYAVLERAAKDLRSGEKKKRQGKQPTMYEIDAEKFFTSGEAYDIYGDIANIIYKRILNEDNKKE